MAFSGVTVGEGSSIVTAAAQVTAVAQALAQGLPHAVSVVKKKSFFNKKYMGKNKTHLIGQDQIKQWAQRSLSLLNDSVRKTGDSTASCPPSRA